MRHATQRPVAVGPHHVRGAGDLVRDAQRARQEFRRPRGRDVVPVLIVFDGAREGEGDPQRVRAVPVELLLEQHEVALALGHLRAAEDHHALIDQAGERFGEVHQPHVVQGLRDEPRVQQVEDGVLDAADVEVHGRPLRRLARRERGVRVPRRQESQEVPGAVHERVHGVRVAPSRRTRLGIRRRDPPRGAAEGRGALRQHVEPVRIRQRHGQLVVGHRQHATVLGVHHRDGRAPEALSRDQPVPQPERLGGPSGAGRRQLIDDAGDGGALGQAVQRPGVDHPAVAAEGDARDGGIDLRERRCGCIGLVGVVGLDDRDRAGDGRGGVHHDAHRQIERAREVEVALIVRRHPHHRTVPVVGQHVVRGPDRQPVAVDGVDGEPLEEHAGLRTVGRLPLDLTRLLHALQICLEAHTHVGR